MEDVVIILPFGLIYDYIFGIIFGHEVYFMFIWYIFPVLVCCINKNLATLTENR
jgi:hypothetical protein